MTISATFTYVHRRYVEAAPPARRLVQPVHQRRFVHLRPADQRRHARLLHLEQGDSRQPHVQRERGAGRRRTSRSASASRWSSCAATRSASPTVRTARRSRSPERPRRRSTPTRRPAGPRAAGTSAARACRRTRGAPSRRTSGTSVTARLAPRPRRARPTATRAGARSPRRSTSWTPADCSRPPPRSRSPSPCPRSRSRWHRACPRGGLPVGASLTVPVTVTAVGTNLTGVRLDPVVLAGGSARQRIARARGAARRPHAAKGASWRGTVTLTGQGGRQGIAHRLGAGNVGRRDGHRQRQRCRAGRLRRAGRHGDHEARHRRPARVGEGCRRQAHGEGHAHADQQVLRAR